MADVSLTKHDIGVLEKIRDPESGLSPGIVIDDTLPRDPHVQDEQLYQRIVAKEREIVLSIQQIELQLAGLRQPLDDTPVVTKYQTCVQSLSNLIQDHSDYASARNNRAQALRRLYGDLILVKDAEPHPGSTALYAEASEEETASAAATILADLSTAIQLLTPATPWAAISPQAAKTLSSAYTQRGALYHAMSKQAKDDTIELRNGARLSRIEAEEQASRNFQQGGRYGNEIAKALAVATNPSAKLCGEIVRNAMKKEYGLAG